MYREDKPGGGGVEQGARITRWLPHGEGMPLVIFVVDIANTIFITMYRVFFFTGKKFKYGKPSLGESTLT